MLPKTCSFLSTSEIQDRRELRSFCLLRRSGLARPSNSQRRQLSHSLTPSLQMEGTGALLRVAADTLPFEASGSHTLTLSFHRGGATTSLYIQWSRFLPKLVAHTLSHFPFTEEGEGLLLHLWTVVSLLNLTWLSTLCPSNLVAPHFTFTSCTIAISSTSISISLLQWCFSPNASGVCQNIVCFGGSLLWLF